MAHHLRKYNQKSSLIRIPQGFFNPLRIKNECQRELYRPLKKHFYFWRRMMFRHGFIYQEFRASQILSENVGPTMKEVQMF